MSVRDWLFRQARSEARGRGALWAGRFALAGLAAIALLLFLDRAGYDLGVFRLPDVGRPEGWMDRAWGWFLLSGAALLQAAAAVATVLAVSFVLRFVLGFALRRRTRSVARLLDRRLSTETFCAALEATGPLGPLVEREALAARPADGFFAPRRGRRRLKILQALALALILVLALLPGVAPGQEGDAPVLGAPDPGQRENRLSLTLTGPVRPLGPGDPIALEVLGELSRAPSTDLELPVFLVLDGSTKLATGGALFLPAGAPAQDTVRTDLARMLPPLQPGEHTVVALAGGARSNVWTFRIEGEPEGGGAAEDEEEQEKKPDPSPEGSATPPPELRPQFVEPLVREGEKVEKLARVPIEVPGGGAPKDATLEEAWPELERRKEAALNRAGLSPAARDLVRRYFEELRPKEERK